MRVYTHMYWPMSYVCHYLWVSTCGIICVCPLHCLQCPLHSLSFHLKCRNAKSLTTYNNNHGEQIDSVLRVLSPVTKSWLEIYGFTTIQCKTLNTDSRVIICFRITNTFLLPIAFHYVALQAGTKKNEWGSIPSPNDCSVLWTLTQPINEQLITWNLEMSSLPGEGLHHWPPTPKRRYPNASIALDQQAELHTAEDDFRQGKNLSKIASPRGAFWKSCPLVRGRTASSPLLLIGSAHRGSWAKQHSPAEHPSSLNTPICSWIHQQVQRYGQTLRCGMKNTLVECFVDERWSALCPEEGWNFTFIHT